MHAILPIVYEYVGFTQEIRRKARWCARPPDGEENPFEIDEMPVFINKRWCHHYITCLFVLFKTPKRVLRARRVALKLYCLYPPPTDDCIFV